MHSCPECGQACYCHGDIDDCVVETEEYSSAHCTHPESRDCPCRAEREDEEAEYPEEEPDDGWRPEPNMDQEYL